MAKYHVLAQFSADGLDWRDFDDPHTSGTQWLDCDPHTWYDGIVDEIAADCGMPPGTHVRLLVWPDGEPDRTAETAVYLSTTTVRFPTDARVVVDDTRRLNARPGVVLAGTEVAILPEAAAEQAG